MPRNLLSDTCEQITWFPLSLSLPTHTAEENKPRKRGQWIRVVICTLEQLAVDQQFLQWLPVQNRWLISFWLTLTQTQTRNTYSKTGVSGGTRCSKLSRGTLDEVKNMSCLNYHQSKIRIFHKRSRALEQNATGTMKASHHQLITFKITFSSQKNSHQSTGLPSFSMYLSLTGSKIIVLIFGLCHIYFYFVFYFIIVIFFHKKWFDQL